MCSPTASARPRSPASPGSSRGRSSFAHRAVPSASSASACIPPAPGPLSVIPLHELTDRTSDLDDLLGLAAAELAERCAGVGSGIERVRLTVTWLRRRLLGDAAFPADPAALRVAARIADTAGRASIAALRDETGLSDGRLVSLFRQQVGVTPKRLARIHRFHHALGLVTGAGAPLARVATEAGYYDQPHMNAEFRALAGLTPRQLLAATRYPNGTSLAEST